MAAKRRLVGMCHSGNNFFSPLSLVERDKREKKKCSKKKKIITHWCADYISYYLCLIKYVTQYSVKHNHFLLFSMTLRFYQISSPEFKTNPALFCLINLREKKCSILKNPTPLHCFKSCAPLYGNWHHITPSNLVTTAN